VKAREKFAAKQQIRKNKDLNKNLGQLLEQAAR
jgi:hypothetical protein